MSAAPIDRLGLRPKFWEDTKLEDMNKAEWEALCDGCGKCCLNKIEYEDTGEVFLTRVACRLFDDNTCQCTQYKTRKDIVPECISLTTDTIQTHAYWLPQSCAYRRLFYQEALPDWHPLITGDPDSTHRAGISVRGITVSESDVHEDELEHHLIYEQSEN